MGWLMGLAFFFLLGLGFCGRGCFQVRFDLSQGKILRMVPWVKGEVILRFFESRPQEFTPDFSPLKPYYGGTHLGLFYRMENLSRHGGTPPNPCPFKGK